MGGRGIEGRMYAEACAKSRLCLVGYRPYRAKTDQTLLLTALLAAQVPEPGQMARPAVHYWVTAALIEGLLPRIEDMTEYPGSPRSPASRLDH
jgi:hypothetical protein